MPEDRKDYPMETVEGCEDLYCIDGLTYEAVAQRSGVSISTLKRWGDRYGWSEKRDAIRQARSSARSGRILLHAALIKNCLGTLNAQDAFAVAAIETVVQKAAEAQAKAGIASAAAPERLREIASDTDVVAALEEAVEIKMNGMLTNPAGLTLASLKDLKQVMDFIRDFKARTVPENAGAKPKGLTPETAEIMRRRLLEGTT
jgi:hypothetical protein